MDSCVQKLIIIANEKEQAQTSIQFYQGYYTRIITFKPTVMKSSHSFVTDDRARSLDTRVAWNLRKHLSIERRKTDTQSIAHTK